MEDEINTLMKKHRTSIRTFHKKGKVQSIFNFCYNQNLTVLIRKIINQILQLQFHRFKINYSFGYILKNINDNELRYYHSSFNNSVMMETARLISNRQELIEFLNTLSEESFFEKINRPDSKWKVVDIPNITFYINHLKDAPLGAPISLPDYIKNNHGLRNVSADDHLCFFRCLAVHQGADPRRCEKTAKNLFYKYCTRFDVAPADFAGVQLFDFVHLEDFFELNLIAYELDGKVAKLVQWSREFYKETMRLNVYENHLSVIVNFESYCGVYQCVHCDKLWTENNNYYRHTKSCTTTVREIFPGGIHKNPATIFEKLEEIGIVVPHCDRYFPFFACYDFEAYFSKKQISNSSMLTLDACHIPLSVAVASNIPGYESGVCFVTEGSEEELVQKLVDYLETLSEVSYKFLLEKFNYVFEQLERSRRRRRHRLKGIHSRPDTNRTGAEGLSFYYPRLLHCLDQMLAVILLSQHRVSSSKTVRPRAPCGARCMGHIVSTWSAVCSEAPHSQFGEGARPHLCMDEWNRPTPVRRRLSLTQAARGKPIPTGLTLVPGTKARSLEALSQYSAFHL